MQKHKYIIIAAVTMAIVAGALVGYNNITGKNDDIETISQSENSTTITMSAIVPELTIEEIIKASDATVIGTVKEILTAQRGKFFVDDIIYHDVIVEVKRYISGGNEQQEIVIRLFGGTIDDTTMITESEPEFKEGEQVLLLLYHPPEDSMNALPEGINKFGLFHIFGKEGKFTLHDENTVCNSKNESIPLSIIENKINEALKPE